MSPYAQRHGTFPGGDPSQELQPNFQLIPEIPKDPTTASKGLQVSGASAKVRLHGSTRLGRHGLHVQNKNLCWANSFVGKHLDIWENTLWTDEIKLLQDLEKLLW